METYHYSFRHYDDLSLRKRYARTKVFKPSYFYRVVDTWNSLPEHIHGATSVNSFKVGVKKFLWVRTFFVCFVCSQSIPTILPLLLLINNLLMNICNIFRVKL